MIDYHRMNAYEARKIEALFFDEKVEYRKHFTAFVDHAGLESQVVSAIHDRFYTLSIDGDIGGFFCLRGMDAGYKRPSFGVYVSSNHSGKGLASFAVENSLLITKEKGMEALMLKVSPLNTVAKKIYEKYGFIAFDVCNASGHLMMQKEI